jgi:hypothetical protein
MAEKSPNKAERAELYRAFLEDDSESLRIILRHAGQSLFLKARPSGQVGNLLRAVAETQSRHDNPPDVVFHNEESLFERIKRVLG